jgi:hypothetical protein
MSSSGFASAEQPSTSFALPFKLFLFNVEQKIDFFPIAREKNFKVFVVVVKGARKESCSPTPTGRR